MLFDEYLQQLPKITRQQLQKKLNILKPESEITKYMIVNLHKEPRLKKEDWDLLVEALKNVPNSAGELVQAIRKSCQDGRSSRCTPAKIAPNITLGRVVTVERYCEWLVKEYKAVTHSEAEAALEVVLNQPPWNMDEERKQWPLGRYLMWSTFTPEQPNHPFGIPIPPVQELMGQLGKDYTFEEGPVLSLEYVLPEGCVPCIPTFWEAYASEQWSLHFCPSNEGEPWGWTVPTDAVSRRKSRPEIVHKTFDARNLRKPMRYLK